MIIPGYFGGANSNGGSSGSGFVAVGSLPATAAVGDAVRLPDGRYFVAIGVNTWAELLNASNVITAFYADGSGTNTVTATVTPAPAAYVEGLAVRIQFPNANTGAVTLNLNGLGAVNVVKNGSTALVSGDISAGQIVFLVYDGTNFQVVGGGGGGGAASPDAGTANYRLFPYQFSGSGVALVGSANQVRGLRWLNERPLDCRRISYRLANTVGGALSSFAVYLDNASAPLITTGALAHNAGTGGANVNAIIPAGMILVCWTSTDATATALGGVIGDANTMSVTNENTVQAFTAANASSAGVMPATLGTLSAIGASMNAPLIKFNG